MPVTFCPIASGSSGNCVFISSGKTNILVDAGISCVRIEKSLSELKVQGRAIDAVFITHEHSDHTLAALSFSRRFDIPVYATSKTWNVIEKNGELMSVSKQNKRYVYGDETVYLNDIQIIPFKIPHDAADPVGYNIFIDDKKVTVVTDIGYVPDNVKQSIEGSNILLIESNHDVDMLMNGRYPLQLKRRILSNEGHLSNVSCGTILSEIMTSNLKHIFLGHLSTDNNKPVLAYETVSNILLANNIKLGSERNLYIAERSRLSNPVCI